MSEQKNVRTLKTVEVSGSHYEMGYQYGRSCPEISNMLDLTYELFGDRDTAKSIFEKYVAMYLPLTEKYAPDIIEEMKGMAEGANVRFEDIFSLNITYEISVPSVMGGCTSFAAFGEAAADGKLIAGQNLDHIEPWQDYLVLLKMKPSDGPDIMAVTAPGCLDLIGINSAGISVNMNLLRTGTSIEPSSGVPTHVILRKLFMSEHLAEAVAAIASAGGRSAKNYLITKAGEGMVDIETTANDMEILFPEKGMLTHTNHFTAERFKSADLAPLIVPDAYIRSHRIHRLMERDYGHVSVDTMKEVLRDHTGYPDSICRHPDSKALLPIARIMKTLISIISCPGERKVYVAAGNPCDTEYVEYRM